MTGKELRSLRTKRKVTGKLLASCGGWSAAYVHKLEHAPQVSSAQAARYGLALEKAALQVSEALAAEDAEARAAVSRFSPATVSSRPPVRAFSSEVISAGSAVSRLPSPPPPPKTSTYTFESVRGLLDAKFGTPEVRAKDLLYTIPASPRSGGGFLLLTHDSWSLRVFLPHRREYEVTQGADFDELVNHLRGLRLLV